MVRIARERIADLFALAQRESDRRDGGLADRYVTLARKVGTRYNVRFPAEYQDLYCRGCSAYWVEGRTVRTRLRRTGRVRTCLRCGRMRRVPVRTTEDRREAPDAVSAAVPRDDEALVGELVETDEERDVDGAEDE